MDSLNVEGSPGAGAMWGLPLESLLTGTENQESAGQEEKRKGKRVSPSRCGTSADGPASRCVSLKVDVLNGLPGIVVVTISIETRFIRATLGAVFRFTCALIGTKWR